MSTKLLVFALVFAFMSLCHADEPDTCANVLWQFGTYEGRYDVDSLLAWEAQCKDVLAHQDHPFNPDSCGRGVYDYGQMSLRAAYALYQGTTYSRAILKKDPRQRAEMEAWQALEFAIRQFNNDLCELSGYGGSGIGQSQMRAIWFIAQSRKEDQKLLYDILCDTTDTILSAPYPSCAKKLFIETIDEACSRTSYWPCGTDDIDVEENYRSYYYRMMKEKQDVLLCLEQWYAVRMEMAEAVYHDDTSPYMMATSLLLIRLSADIVHFSY